MKQFKPMFSKRGTWRNSILLTIDDVVGWIHYYRATKQFH